MLYIQVFLIMFSKLNKYALKFVIKNKNRILMFNQKNLFRLNRDFKRLDLSLTFFLKKTKKKNNLIFSFQNERIKFDYLFFNRIYLKKKKSKLFNYKNVKSDLKVLNNNSFNTPDLIKNQSLLSQPTLLKRSNFASYLLREKRMINTLRNENNPNSLDNQIETFAPIFWNLTFDKGRLKSFISWYFKNYGQRRTLNLLEKLKTLGFGFATKAGISLGIDDLQIPPNKKKLLAKAEISERMTINLYKKAEITSLERFQTVIETWHNTSELLKDALVLNFQKTDILNPVFMMAFSGARGNISQVRQLAGMRGLMADPQGQILDFPIQSNFREGLTLTEYVISCYGARKGVVDTALRTADAGYLTRRLVDVAHQVIVSHIDCGTKKGIFLTEMKSGNKSIFPLNLRLLGRVLAADVFKIINGISKENGSKIEKIANRNTEINEELASLLGSLLSKKNNSILQKNVFSAMPQFSDKLLQTNNTFKTFIPETLPAVYVRSPLACQSKKFICQLCYGWSLADGHLVSVGEAVGIIAAQSIGEPGTQLTMRTFHTGGVFAGEAIQQIKSPYNAIVEYLSPIQGSLVRTSQGDIAFLTKGTGELLLKPQISKTPEDLKFNDQTKKDLTNKKNISYKLPSYSLLFIRNQENVRQGTLVAQTGLTPSYSLENLSIGEYAVNSVIEGEMRYNNVDIVSFLLNSNNNNSPNPFKNYDDAQTSALLSLTEKKQEAVKSIGEFNDLIEQSLNWGYVHVLAGKIVSLPLYSDFFPEKGDLMDQKSSVCQIHWVTPLNCYLSTNFLKKKLLNLPLKIEKKFLKVFLYQRGTNIERLKKNLLTRLIKKNSKLKRYSNKKKRNKILIKKSNRIKKNLSLYSIDLTSLNKTFIKSVGIKTKDSNKNKIDEMSVSLSGTDFASASLKNDKKLLSEAFQVGSIKNWRQRSNNSQEQPLTSSNKKTQNILALTPQDSLFKNDFIKGNTKMTNKMFYTPTGIRKGKAVLKDEPSGFKTAFIKKTNRTNNTCFFSKLNSLKKQSMVHNFISFDRPILYLPIKKTFYKGFGYLFSISTLGCQRKKTKPQQNDLFLQNQKILECVIKNKRIIRNQNMNSSFIIKSFNTYFRNNQSFFLFDKDCSSKSFLNKNSLLEKKQQDVFFAPLSLASSENYHFKKEALKRLKQEMNEATSRSGVEKSLTSANINNTFAVKTKKANRQTPFLKKEFKSTFKTLQKSRILQWFASQYQTLTGGLITKESFDLSSFKNIKEIRKALVKPLTEVFKTKKTSVKSKIKKRNIEFQKEPKSTLKTPIQCLKLVPILKTKQELELTFLIKDRSEFISYIKKEDSSLPNHKLLILKKSFLMNKPSWFLKKRQIKNKNKKKILFKPRIYWSPQQIYNLSFLKKNKIYYNNTLTKPLLVLSNSQRDLKLIDCFKAGYIKCFQKSTLLDSGHLKKSINKINGLSRKRKKGFYNNELPIQFKSSAHLFLIKKLHSFRYKKRLSLLTSLSLSSKLLNKYLLKKELSSYSMYSNNIQKRLSKKGLFFKGPLEKVNNHKQVKKNKKNISSTLFHRILKLKKKSVSQKSFLKSYFVWGISQLISNKSQTRIPLFVMKEVLKALEKKQFKKTLLQLVLKRTSLIKALKVLALIKKLIIPFFLREKHIATFKGKVKRKHKLPVQKKNIEKNSNAKKPLRLKNFSLVFTSSLSASLKKIVHPFLLQERLNFKKFKIKNALSSLFCRPFLKDQKTLFSQTNPTKEQKKRKQILKKTNAYLNIPTSFKNNKKSILNKTNKLSVKPGWIYCPFLKSKSPLNLNVSSLLIKKNFKKDINYKLLKSKNKKSLDFKILKAQKRLLVAENKLIKAAMNSLGKKLFSSFKIKQSSSFLRMNLANEKNLLKQNIPYLPLNISCHKKYILPGQKIIENIQFDQQMVYAEFILTSLNTNKPFKIFTLLNMSKVYKRKKRALICFLNKRQAPAKLLLLKNVSLPLPLFLKSKKTFDSWYTKMQKQFNKKNKTILPLQFTNFIKKTILLKNRDSETDTLLLFNDHRNNSIFTLYNTKLSLMSFKKKNSANKVKYQSDDISPNSLLSINNLKKERNLHRNNEEKEQGLTIKQTKIDWIVNNNSRFNPQIFMNNCVKQTLNKKRINNNKKKNKNINVVPLLYKNSSLDKLNNTSLKHKRKVKIKSLSVKNKITSLLPDYFCSNKQVFLLIRKVIEYPTVDVKKYKNCIYDKFSNKIHQLNNSVLLQNQYVSNFLNKQKPTLKLVSNFPNIDFDVNAYSKIDLSTNAYKNNKNIKNKLFHKLEQNIVDHSQIKKRKDNKSNLFLNKRDGDDLSIKSTVIKKKVQKNNKVFPNILFKSELGLSSFKKRNKMFNSLQFFNKEIYVSWKSINLMEIFIEIFTNPLNNSNRLLPKNKNKPSLTFSGFDRQKKPTESGQFKQLMDSNSPFLVSKVYFNNNQNTPLAISNLRENLHLKGSSPTFSVLQKKNLLLKNVQKSVILKMISNLTLKTKTQSLIKARKIGLSKTFYLDKELRLPNLVPGTILNSSIWSSLFSQPCIHWNFTQNMVFGTEFSFVPLKKIRGIKKFELVNENVSLSSLKTRPDLLPIEAEFLISDNNYISALKPFVKTHFLSPCFGEVVSPKKQKLFSFYQKTRHLILTPENLFSCKLPVGLFKPNSNLSLQKNFDSSKQTDNSIKPKNTFSYINIGKFVFKGDSLFLKSNTNLQKNGTVSEQNPDSFNTNISKDVPFSFIDKNKTAKNDTFLTNKKIDSSSIKVMLSDSGQIVHINSKKVTIRRAQPIFFSGKCIFHIQHRDFVQKNRPVLSLPYLRLKTGDIVQGIPKIEQLFEGRTSFGGEIEYDSLPNLLKIIYQNYRKKLPMALAVQKSLQLIRCVLVNSIQRVYRSQGVSVSDKHIEVVVKQMTLRVRITYPGTSGFFRGESIELRLVLKWNFKKRPEQRIRYEPIIQGITKASLQADSFLSAASFQYTNRVLKDSAFKRKIDFLNGLKENIIIGNLIPVGTGFFSLNQIKKKT